MKEGFSEQEYIGFFIVRAKRQPWASSLCHPIVLHTNVDL